MDNLAGAAEWAYASVEGATGHSAVTKFLKSAAFLSSLVLAAACASGGIVSDDAISDAADRQWDELLETMTVSENARYQRRASLVARKLLSAANEDPSQWRVVVFEDDEFVNAFALPNRSIGVFTGIFEVVENDDQLAVVIGHEIAHVQLRHAQSRSRQTLAPRILIGAAQLPGEITDIGAVKTAGAIAGAPIAIGAVLPFGRKQESEADIVGFEYLTGAGFDPNAAPALWRNIEAHKENASEIPAFLSTHPSSEKRIERLEAAAAGVNI